MIAPSPVSATPRSLITMLLLLVSRIASIIVIMVGGLVILGWALDIAILKSIGLGPVAIKTNTALAFILAGFALFTIGQAHGTRRWVWARRAAAIAVALIGFLTLHEYVFGHELHIDQLFFADPTSSTISGRMAPAAALCCCLFGLALLLLDTQHGYRIASMLIFAALLIAWIAVIGHIYGVASLYTIDTVSTLAIPTATTFIILGMGMLLAQPERGLIGLTISPTAGGMMARRMLPAAIIIPFLLGWLRWQGQLLGLYGTEFGLSLMVILLTTVFTLFIWWNAGSLYRLDRERMHTETILRKSEAQFGRMFQFSPAAMLIAKRSNGQIMHVNESYQRLLGYHADELCQHSGGSLNIYVDDQQLAQMMNLIRSHGSFDGHELTLRTKSGDIREVLASAEMIELDNELCILSTFVDITERRAVERALRQSEELFAKAFRSTPAALFITRLADGCIVDANESYIDLFGYRRDELVGHTMREVDIYLQPDQRDEIVQRLRDHGTIRGAELMLRAKSGALLEVLFSLEEIDLDGEACILGIVYDITERKHTQEALLRSEARFHNMLDTMLEGFQIIGFDWRYLYLNDSAIRQGMRAREDLLGLTMMEAYPGIEATELFSILQRCMEQRTPHRMHNHFDYGDGASGWFDLSIQPGPDGILVLSVDITTRKQAELQLLATTNRLRVLADASRAFAEAGTEYQALLEYVAWKTSEVLGEGCCLRMLSDDAQWLNLVAVHDVDIEKRELVRIVLGETPQSINEPSLVNQIFQNQSPLLVATIDRQQIRAATKSEFWQLADRLEIHSMLGVPMRVQGRVIGVLIVYRHMPERPSFNEDDLILAQDLADRAALAINNAHLLVQVQHELAERTKAEAEVRTLSVELEQRVVARTAELAAANQELEAFSYSVSHDLRAPLRAIDGFSRILLDDYIADLPDQAQYYFQLVRNNTLQMGHLVDDLLAFSRLSRQPISKRDVVMEQLVRQCLHELRDEQTGRQIDLQISDMPPSAGDPALLKQVWFNLLSNALKYTRRRTPAVIEIGSHLQGNQLVYFVKDNGVGFDMRYISKLFGVFQRMHRAEDYEGTGVGLAIVQRIVQRHKGRIWAEAAVDVGAAFYFTLEELPDSGHI